MAFLRRHGKACVAHAEGSKAFESRQQEAEQIGRVAVMKAFAGLIDQRQRGKTRDPLIRRKRIVDLRAQRGIRRVGARVTRIAAARIA